MSNQTKRDGMTVIVAIRGNRRGTICFASSFCCTPDFFVFSIRLLMHSKLSAAYAVQLYAQRGSGAYTDSPGSFREAGCSQPSGDSLHLESFSVSGVGKVDKQGGGLNISGREGRMYACCSVFRDEVRKPKCRLFAEQRFSVGPLNW